MANEKISALAAILGANLAASDLFVVVDVSDTSMAASGTDKSLTFSELSSVLGGSGLPGGVAFTTTTMADSVSGSGNMTVALFTGDDAAIAIGQSGDAFPRWLLTSDPGDGFYLGDGTFDPYGGGIAFWIGGNGDGTGNLNMNGAGCQLRAGAKHSDRGHTNASSSGLAIGNAVAGAAQACLSTGAGDPTSYLGGALGDFYLRVDPSGANTTFYRCTTSGVGGAAVWTGIL